MVNIGSIFESQKNSEKSQVRGFVLGQSLRCIDQLGLVGSR